MQSCYLTCLQRNIIERCGCGDAQYPLNGTAFGSTEMYPPCDIMNSTIGTVAGNFVNLTACVIANWYSFSKIEQLKKKLGT